MEDWIVPVVFLVIFLVSILVPAISDKKLNEIHKSIDDDLRQILEELKEIE